MIKCIFLLILLGAHMFFAQTTVVKYVKSEYFSSEKFPEFIMFNDDELFYCTDVDQKYATTEDFFKNYDFNRGGKMYRTTKEPNAINWFTAYLFERNKRLIVDNKPSIEWEIKRESKEILGYTCTKAEGDFRGRHYTVWFTKDIPAAWGPWKLDGLPGLILEARDSEGVVNFHAVEVIKNSHLTIPQVAKDFRYKALETNNTGDFKVYIEKLITFSKEQQLRSIANIPKDAKLEGPISHYRSLWEELVFEWEDPKVVLKGYIKRKDE